MMATPQGAVPALFQQKPGNSFQLSIQVPTYQPRPPILSFPNYEKVWERRAHLEMFSTVVCTSAGPAGAASMTWAGQAALGAEVQSSLRGHERGPVTGLFIPRVSVPCSRFLQNVCSPELPSKCRSETTGLPAPIPLGRRGTITHSSLLEPLGKMNLNLFVLSENIRNHGP